MNIPDDFYPFQAEGVDFLLGRRKPSAGLLYDMGLGKSAVSIVAGQERGSIVIVCPAVACINWTREFHLWWRGPAMSIEIATSRSQPVADVVVVSYGLLTKWGNKLPTELRSRTWDLCIVDEGQFLKTPTSGRTQCVYGKGAQGLECITANAADTWVLSGTLTPNHIGELYTHVSALWPGMITFGSTKMAHWQFLQRYGVCRETVYGTQVIGSKNLHELKPKFRQVAIKRTKAQVLPDLPPLDFKTLPVKADTRMLVEASRANPHVAAIVDDLQAMLEAAEGDVEVLLDSFSDQLSTLRKAIGDIKVKPVCDIIADRLAAGLPKLIVFGYHRSVVDGIFNRFSSHAVILHGGTAAGARQRAIDSFQHDSKIRLFVGQLQACGTAITLTAASRVLFAESSWVPAENVQAACRAHRIGQKDGVLAELVALDGSIDIPLQHVLQRKSNDLAQTWEDMAA